MCEKIKFRIFVVMFLIFVICLSTNAQNSSFNNLENKNNIIKLNSIGVQIGYSFISLHKPIRPHYRFSSSLRLLESNKFNLDFVFEYFQTSILDP